MESSQIWGFFNILSQSLKIVVRNAILIALATILSILLTTILYLLFSFSFEMANKYIINTTSGVFVFVLQTTIFFALIFAAQFTFMFSYVAIAHALGLATVTAAAVSYTDGDGAKLSLADLFSRIRTKWRSPFRFRKNNMSGSIRRRAMLFLTIVAVSVGIPVVIFYPNPLTISVAVSVGVLIFVFYLYASVGWEMAAVVMVVEDGCEAAEAMEKAEKLVEGSRVQGFMVNVLFNIVGLIVLLSLWMIFGDRGSPSLNTTVFGLFFLNCATVMRIFLTVAYTVYYFRCKAHKIQLYGDFNYTTVLVY